jgi:hypothetical protein
MKLHELETLNEYKEENRGLKQTAESLRGRNAALQESEAAHKLAAEGTSLALDSLIKALRIAVPNDLFDKIMARAHEISGAPAKDIKPNKRNRPLQVVP